MNIHIPFISDALGHSVIYEEYKGDFALARQSAEGQLTAARQQHDPAFLADALLARGVVHLLQGEPAAAQRCFRELEETVPGDFDRRLRAASYNNLATFWRYNLFPDGAGAGAAELGLRWDGRAYLEAEIPRRKEIFSRASDPLARFESMLVKDFLSTLQAPRAFVFSSRYGTPGTDPGQLLPTALQTPVGFRETAEIYDAAPALLAYADVAAADLCQRAGDMQTRVEFLRRALETYRQSNDMAGMASVQLLWGDWLAAPFSTPRVWNMAIQESGSSGSYLAWTWEAVERGYEPDNLEQAEAAYGEAERLFRAANAPRGLANVFLRHGYLATLRGDWALAGEAVTRAQEAYEACGDYLGAWLARVHGALCGIGSARFPEDLDAARAAGAWGAAEGSFSYALGLGLMIGRTGRDWLVRQGDYERALACYRLAEALYEELGAEVNRTQSMVDQGMVYQAIGARTPALTKYEESLDRFEKDVRARPALADKLRPHVFMLSADVYQLYLQDMDADGMQRSVDRMQTQLSEMPGGGAGLGMLAQVLGSGLSGLMSGETSDASLTGIETFALSQMARSFIEQASVLVPLYRARQARDQGDEIRAERLFAEARAAAQAAGPAQRDYLIANVLAHQRAYAEARQAFERYLAQGGANTGFVGQLAAVMETVGGQQGQMEAARQQQRTAEQAFTFMVRVKAYDEARRYLAQLQQFSEEWWEEDASPWLSLSDCGELFEGLEDLDAALVYYDRAIQELEKRRTLLSRDELKTALAADKGVQYLYFQAAHTALKRAAPVRGGKVDQEFASLAYSYAERGKARALLDLMAGSLAVAGSAVHDGQNVRAWREHNARLTLWSGLLAQERSRRNADQEKIGALQESIKSEETALHQVEALLARSDPGFYWTLNPPAQTLSLEEVGQHLPSDTLLLQYYILGDDLLAWAIGSQGDPEVHRAAVDAQELARRIRVLHQACERRKPLDGLGDELRDHLLLPFEAAIDGVRQLIIVPYGASHLLPFGVLPWQGNQPLAATHTISYLPSASVLQFRRSDRGLPEGILAVGDPANMAYAPPLGARRRKAPSLPAAATEADYVASLFPRGKALIGSAATEEAVRPLLNKYPILHFATHGRLSEEAPMLSSILLADGQELSLHELMGLQLSADLVVLSACQTGLGETTGGDDVLGLTRGLLGAGARTAIVSLWRVNDLSTSFLMSAFYRELLAGGGPASALQEAQEYLRKMSPDEIAAATRELEITGFLRDMEMDEAIEPPEDFSHPHFWAPFILVG